MGAELLELKMNETDKTDADAAIGQIEKALAKAQS